MPHCVFSRYGIITFPVNLMIYLLTVEVFSMTYDYVNFPTLGNSAIGLSNISTQEALNKLNDTKELKYMSVICIELVCIGSLFLIFPIFYRI